MSYTELHYFHVIIYVYFIEDTDILQYFTLFWWVTPCLIGIFRLMICNKSLTNPFVFSGKISAFVGIVHFSGSAAAAWWLMMSFAGGRGKTGFCPSRQPNKADYSHLFINLDRPWPTLTSLSLKLTSCLLQQKIKQVQLFRRNEGRHAEIWVTWELKWRGANGGFPLSARSNLPLQTLAKQVGSVVRQ